MSNGPSNTNAQKPKIPAPKGQETIAGAQALVRPGRMSAPPPELGLALPVPGGGHEPSPRRETPFEHGVSPSPDSLALAAHNA
jgi:hypothetical protein